jgi:hypothetical protein
MRSRIERVIFIADLFRNEFGRRVLISLRDMGRKYNAPLRITISRKGSDQVSYVTYAEAERLRDLLNKALSE